MTKQDLYNEMMRLRRLLDDAFDASTSLDPKTWHVNNPSKGHCAVVAIIIERWLPSDCHPQLASTRICGTSHWFARAFTEAVAENGDPIVVPLAVDLTADQFGFEKIEIDRDLYSSARIRTYDEIDDATLRRAELLAQRIKYHSLVEEIRNIRENR